MKTQALIMILLLLCAAIFASEDGSNAAEYERKTQELNQLAERFKEETGFVGEVGNSIDTMRLHTYRGNFSGVYLPAEGDTIAFRLACEQIIDKILPFSPANRMQLSMSRISKSVRGYTTDYIQLVGGYRVEGAGLIMITSDSGRKHFSIGDNTVDISNELVEINITEDQAIDAVIQRYEPRENFDKNHWMFRRHVRLVYAPIEYESGAVEFKLCYLIPSVGGTRYVDPTTGEIIYTRFILKANDD